MTIKTTLIADILLLEPKVYYDERGYFMESFNEREFEALQKVKFVQDNESMSKKDVLRGLHFQRPPHAQAKLVRVICGSVFDVAVDLRLSSPTYGNYFGHVLSDKNKLQLYIPAGFAHGFLSLEDNTIVNYKCSDYYYKDAEDSILWNDVQLGIDWAVTNPVLALKDQTAQKFSAFKSPFK
jgi:dTDP-4-dehydrorhamnose 3,5-epimerase